MTEGITITQNALSRRLCGMPDCIPMASFITRAELRRRSSSFGADRASSPGGFASRVRPANKLNRIAENSRLITSSFPGGDEVCAAPMRNGPSGLLVGHRLPQGIEKPLEESSRSSPNLIAIPPKGAINLVDGLSEVEWLRTGRYRTGVFHSSGTD